MGIVTEADFGPLEKAEPRSFATRVGAAAGILDLTPSWDMHPRVAAFECSDTWLQAASKLEGLYRVLGVLRSVERLTGARVVVIRLSYSKLAKISVIEMGKQHTLLNFEN